MKHILLLLFTTSLIFSFQKQVEAARIKVPIDVAAGPEFFNLPGFVGDDQSFHYGINLSLNAIIDKNLIKKNKKKIPKKYYRYIKNIDELRFSPSILIPRSIYISPKTKNTSLYGVSWVPIGTDIVFIKKPFRVSLDFGTLITYLYVDSTVFPSPIHFLRPGIESKLNFEFPVSRKLLLSTGAAFQAYIPQGINQGFFSAGSEKTRIWNAARLYFLIHYRFGYTLNL